MKYTRREVFQRLAAAAAASRDDVVGIKVNPNGLPSLVSSKAVIDGITQGLLLAGVERANIVICDRNRAQLNRIAGWLPAGVRLAAASWEWSGDQTEIAGYNPGKNPGVSGYNPGYFVDCPEYLLPWQSKKNPSHTRSYVANFVTQVTKIISLSVLKDHQAAGVTSGLKRHPWFVERRPAGRPGLCLGSPHDVLRNGRGGDRSDWVESH